MKRLTLVGLCVLSSAPVWAAESRAPAAVKTEAPTGNGKISVQFHGPLRDALKKIAAQGGLNLIVTGNLDETAEVMLNDVSAPDALSIVADAYHLVATRKGSIWTLRPMTSDEVDAANEKDSDKDNDHDDDEAPEPAMAPVAPMPPMPALPPMAHFDPDEFRQQMQQRYQDRVGEKLRRKLDRIGEHGNDLTGMGALTVNEDQEVHDVVSYGGGVNVLGHVTGDAVAFGGPVHLGKDAVVEGDVLAVGGPVDREEGAEVNGEVVALGSATVGTGLATAITRGVRAANDDGEHEHHHHEGSSSGFPALLAQFAVLFGLGFLATLFAPSRMKSLEAEIKRDPLRCVGTGILGALALFPLTLLLCVTIIGIPVVAFVEAPLLVVGVVMGLSAVASEIGLRIPLRNLRKTQAVVLAVGLLILLVAGIVPVLGPLVLSAMVFLSLGAIIRTRFGSRRQGIPEPV